MIATTARRSLTISAASFAAGPLEMASRTFGEPRTSGSEPRRRLRSSRASGHSGGRPQAITERFRTTTRSRPAPAAAGATSGIASARSAPAGAAA
eukprot:4806872-Heterocapsa_arctica.AAC.1